ncbi:MAG TPA: Dna2/Cas4 domain-containing protein [bacterium]|nr:Dna2/Cas4 domain-containing protein [bacterium]
MLKEVITKYYSDLRKEMGQHHFYITDAGKCQRAIFFRFKKAPAEAMEPRLLMIFDHGDHIHQMIMKALFGARKMHVVAAEVNIPPQEIVSGRADAILSDGKDLYVLDIKSINGQIFRNLSSPKSDHINQVQLYLHFFKLKKGILLYVNKDTQELKEFLVDYNQQICEYLLRELSLLKDKIERNIVPPRISNLSDKWQCQYCQFKEICRIAGPEEVDWNLFKKKIETISSMRIS